MGNVCSECGHTVSEGVLFCAQCGSRLASRPGHGGQTVSGPNAKVINIGRDNNAEIYMLDMARDVIDPISQSKIPVDFSETSITDTHIDNKVAMFVAALIFSFSGIEAIASLLTVVGVDASSIRWFYDKIGITNNISLTIMMIRSFMLFLNPIPS